MKKLGLNPVFRSLLIFITVVLFVCNGAGCGKKSPPKSPPSKEPTVNTIQFSIPELYKDQETNKMHLIPNDKRVTFYVVSLESNPESTIEPLHTFTGTTDNQNFQFKIPDFLYNEEGYVFAVVDLDEPFDLNGKTMSEVQAATTNGTILFGQAPDNVIFRNNTVVNFGFIGKGEGPTVSTISFTMPTSYEAGDFEYDIPPGKDVIFFSIASPPEQPDDKINADKYFSALTEEETSEHTLSLPDELLGQERYFFAVVILKGSFDLQGKNWGELFAARDNGTILLGQAKKPEDDNEIELHSLYDGIIIGNFKFEGQAPDVSDPKITFRFPPTCKSGTPIPKGKPVKIYTTGELDELFISDNVFSGTTGADITCDLPSELIGEERDLYVVVILKGSFDPREKPFAQLMNAVIEEEIMLGVIEDVVILSPGMLIDADAFEFYGKADIGD